MGAIAQIDGDDLEAAFATLTRGRGDIDPKGLSTPIDADHPDYEKYQRLDQIQGIHSRLKGRVNALAEYDEFVNDSLHDPLRGAWLVANRVMTSRSRLFDRADCSERQRRSRYFEARIVASAATFQPIMWKSLGKTPAERVY